MRNFMAWFLTDIYINYRILIRILQIQIKEQMNLKQPEDSLFGRELQFMDEQEKIQHQYMCFYDQLDFPDSQQKSYDFENLNLQMLRDCFKANPNTYEILWRPHRHYLCHYGYDFSAVSARVAEIPTVYLVTHIQTQHTPIRKHWRLEDSDEETRGSQLGASGARQVINPNMERIQQTIRYHNEDIEVAQPIEIQSQINNILKENYSNVYNVVNNIKDIKVIRKQMLERKCKTQYNWMKDENLWEKQNKERRIMYRSTVYYRNKLKKSKKRKNTQLKPNNFDWVGAASIKRAEKNNKREGPSQEKIKCWRKHEKEKHSDFNINPQISDGPNLQKIDEDISIIGYCLQQGLKERAKKSMNIDQIVSVDLVINENEGWKRQRQEKKHHMSQNKEIQNKKHKYTKFSYERECSKTALKQAAIQDGMERKEHEKMRNEQDFDVS